MCAIPQMVSAPLNPSDFRAYLGPSSLKLKIFQVSRLIFTDLYSLLVQKHLFAGIITGLLWSLDINNKIAKTKAT